jgi:hypothetical protein
MNKIAKQLPLAVTLFALVLDMLRLLAAVLNFPVQLFDVVRFLTYPVQMFFATKVRLHPKAPNLFS